MCPDNRSGKGLDHQENVCGWIPNWIKFFHEVNMCLVFYGSTALPIRGRRKNKIEGSSDFTCK